MGLLLRRALPSCALLLVGCTLLTRFEERDDDTSPVVPQCSLGTKACQLESSDVIECVAGGNPNYGCLRTVCAPCAAPNVADFECTESGCVILQCYPGFQDCDDDPRTGCEVKTDGDPKACGSCTGDCFASKPAANFLCASGTCVETSCVAPLANCDADPDCETNTATSLEHCGHCGGVCQLANAASVACVSGQCEIEQCASNFADCDAIGANGCETHLRSDDEHCGECDEACRAGERCIGAACVPL